MKIMPFIGYVIMLIGLTFCDKGCARTEGFWNYVVMFGLGIASVSSILLFFDTVFPIKRKCTCGHKRAEHSQYRDFRMASLPDKNHECNCKYCEMETESPYCDCPKFEGRAMQTSWSGFNSPQGDLK